MEIPNTHANNIFLEYFFGMKKNKARTFELSRRALEGSPTSVDVDARSFEIVITTETPCRTFIPNPNSKNADDEWIEVDEILSAKGLDYSRTPMMPLLDNHDSFTGINAILGKIEDIRADEDKIVGKAVLTNERKSLIADIKEGFFGQVSAGFCVNTYEITERENDIPLAIATSWTLHEASLVPVGADPNAFVRGKREFPIPQVSFRGAETTNIQEKTMDIEELITKAEEALDAVVAAEDGNISDELKTKAAKLRKARMELDATPEEDAEADAEAAEATKSEDDAEIGDDKARAEETEKDNAESVARSYGLTQFAKDLRGLGASAKELRSAIRSEIAKRGAAEETSSAPANNSNLEFRKSSDTPALPTLNSNEIFAARRLAAQGKATA